MGISDELIEGIVRENIEARLEDYDFSYIARDILKSKLDGKAEKIIDEMIKTELKVALDNEINTDDGWGKKEHYENFESLFKTKFKEKMNKDWEMKRVIERAVEERLDKLFKERTKEVTEKIHDLVLNELIKEEK